MATVHFTVFFPFLLPFAFPISSSPLAFPPNLLLFPNFSSSFPPLFSIRPLTSSLSPYPRSIPILAQICRYSAGVIQFYCYFLGIMDRSVDFDGLGTRCAAAVNGIRVLFISLFTPYGELSVRTRSDAHLSRQIAQ